MECLQRAFATTELTSFILVVLTCSNIQTSGLYASVTAFRKQLDATYDHSTVFASWYASRRSDGISFVPLCLNH